MLFLHFCYIIQAYWTRWCWYRTTLGCCLSLGRLTIIISIWEPLFYQLSPWPQACFASSLLWLYSGPFLTVYQSLPLSCLQYCHSNTLLKKKRETEALSNLPTNAELVSQWWCWDSNPVFSLQSLCLTEAQGKRPKDTEWCAIPVLVRPGLAYPPRSD